MFGVKVCPEGHQMDPSWKVCPVCIAPIRGWLVLLNNRGAEKVYNIHEGKSKVGSGADCEIRITKGVNRQHALITALNGEFHITTMGSGGTILVNGQEVASSILIDGDLVQLDKKEFKFKCL